MAEQLELIIHESTTLHRCSGCGEMKPWQGKQRRLAWKCPPCAKRRNAEQRHKWRIDNPDEAKANDRKNRESNRAHNNARALERYYEHHEERKAKARAWKVANRSKVRDNYRVWIHAHPEARRRYRSNRRARKKNAMCDCRPNCYEDKFAELMANPKRRCAEPGCRKRKELTRDHIVPLSLGGAHCGLNCQLMCVSHNSAKNNLPPEEWAARNGRLL